MDTSGGLPHSKLMSHFNTPPFDLYFTVVPPSIQSNLHSQIFKSEKIWQKASRFPILLLTKMTSAAIGIELINSIKIPVPVSIEFVGETRGVPLQISNEDFSVLRRS